MWSEPAPEGGLTTDLSLRVYPDPIVGASLLVKAVSLPIKMPDMRAFSRAGSLPQEKRDPIRNQVGSQAAFRALLK
jgi:hypothetical protein